MDILSLINDVADDVAIANTKNEESYMYAKHYEGIDIDKLRKLISDHPVLLRTMPSYTFAEFRQPTPEHPLTATEMTEMMELVRRRASRDEVRAWQDLQTLDNIMRHQLQPLRFEPEPEPYQEMWMHDRPTAVRW